MKPKLLIVDDEPEIVKVVADVLEDHAVITRAIDGNDAITKFLQVKPDIVITDIRMPGQDGVTLLRELKSLKEDIIVIMITAYGRKEGAIQSLQYGAFDFLEKPLDCEKVLSSVIRATEKINDKVKHQVKVNTMEKYLDYGSLCASILHDATNLITILNGRIYRLKKHAKQAQLSEDVLNTVDGLTKITKMISNLMASAKPFLSSTEDVKNSTVSVNRLVNQTIEFLEYKLEKAKVGLQFEYDKEMQITCEPLQITRILINLITNSIQAMESDSREVKREIRISAKSSENNANIIVEDNGPGVKTEDREKIFEDFYSTKQGIDSSGLGLGICRKICEGYGGSLELLSSQVGAKFQLTIPQAKAN